LAEQNEFIIPSHIRKKIQKIYVGKRTLPNILNCETDFLNKIEVTLTNNQPRVLDVKPLTVIPEENFSSYSI
jgi:hypothetical protein